MSEHPWRRLSIVPALLGLLAVISLAGCAGEDDDGMCSDCNVVLVVADTLRADRLGAYGYARDTSPFFDQLAERGVLFEQTRSTASCTFPSVNSLLTSRSSQLFLDEATRPGIPEAIRSLPEMLGDRGRATVAVSASPVVRATPSKHNPRGGFGRGFDVFDESVIWAHGTHVTLKAQELLQDLDQPFLLYLHYMDPHDPYVPLKQFQGLFAGSYEGPHDFIVKGDPNPLSAMIREQTFDAEIDKDRDLQHLSDLYDESVRTFDLALEHLFRVLDKKGVLDKTVVVVTADHGEGFYEHGAVKHCFTVYDNEVHVPLLFVGPGIGHGRAKVSASLLDVVPTLLEHLGLRPDDGVEPQLEGESLQRFLRNPDLTADRVAFSGMGVYRSVADGHFKLIRDLAADRYELYDVLEDPAEKHDVLATERRVFFHLRQQLHDWIEDKEGEKSAAEREDLAREIEDELRSLGYLG